MANDSFLTEERSFSSVAFGSKLIFFVALGVVFLALLGVTFDPAAAVVCDLVAVVTTFDLGGGCCRLWRVLVALATTFCLGVGCWCVLVALATTFALILGDFLLFFLSGGCRWFLFILVFSFCGSLFSHSSDGRVVCFEVAMVKNGVTEFPDFSDKKEMIQSALKVASILLATVSEKTTWREKLN